MVKSEEEDPYGEKYSQEWPATPYAVRVKNVAGLYTLNPVDAGACFQPLSLYKVKCHASLPAAPSVRVIDVFHNLPSNGSTWCRYDAAYPGPVDAKCFVDGKLACKRQGHSRVSDLLHGLYGVSTRTGWHQRLVF
jgi:hypothetical protein